MFLKKNKFNSQLKDIVVNGQKRGCSGFIINPFTHKICYITTEHFFDGGKGSGLWGDSSKAIMMRTAEGLKDFVGGRNHWIDVEQILTTATKLTA